jgi:hypothetical protein
MAGPKLLRLSAILLLVGLLFTFLVGLFHPDTQDPNNHIAEFTLYANSNIWTAVHLGQFVGMLIIVVGLITLFFALNIQTQVPMWANRFGAISAVTALGLYGVLQAVDGVALKHAVDSWASAPDAEKVARFASAEAIRWLEWGFRSYQSFMLGISLVLFAAAIVLTARLPRLIGYLMGLTGFAYIVQGWIIGSEGFSANNTAPTLLGYILWLVWSVWLLITAWRMQEVTGSANR